MWLAGGGVKGGHIHGATDEYGYFAVDDKVHMHDLHATLLHLLGLDHKRLTYRFRARYASDRRAGRGGSRADCLIQPTSDERGRAFGRSWGSYIRIGGPVFLRRLDHAAANNDGYNDIQSAPSFELAGGLFGTGVDASGATGARIGAGVVPHGNAVSISGQLAAEKGPLFNFLYTIHFGYWISDFHAATAASAVRPAEWGSRRIGLHNARRVGPAKAKDA